MTITAEMLYDAAAKARTGENYTLTTNTGSSAHVVFYQRKAPCPRCDRPARDDAEWRKFAREALEEVQRGE